VVEHVSHAVTLETELGREVEENVLNLLLGERNLSIRGPGRVGLSRALSCGESIGVVHTVDRCRSTRRAVATIRDLRGRRADTTTSLLTAVAVVALITAAVVVHFGGTGHVGSHGEITKGLRILLRMTSVLTTTLLASSLGTLIVVLVVVVLVLVAVVAGVVVFVLTSVALVGTSMSTLVILASGARTRLADAGEGYDRALDIPFIVVAILTIAIALLIVVIVGLIVVILVVGIIAVAVAIVGIVATALMRVRHVVVDYG
jgi:hypothetical protein